MPDKTPAAFSLVVATLEAAFDLITRYTTSADSVGILELNRLLRELKTGDRAALPLAIRGLGTLGWASDFKGFRSAMNRLQHSLPDLCCANVNATHVAVAAEDLKHLAHAANLLRAPDVAATLMQIVRAIFSLAGPGDNKSAGGEPKRRPAQRPDALH